MNARAMMDAARLPPAELIQRLPSKSETLHFLMDGTFTLGNVIPVMQSRHASEWKGDRNLCFHDGGILVSSAFNSKTKAKL